MMGSNQNFMKSISTFGTQSREFERNRGAVDGRRRFGTGHATSPDLFFQNLKLRIHRRLIDTIDLPKLSSLEVEMVKVEIRRILEELVMAESLPLSRADREKLVTEVQHEVFGLGPLESLMKDSEITDILVNTHGLVYVERYGKLEKTEVRFRDDAHLMQIIERIVSRVGRRIDEASPMVDARLPDGSRVNVIIPPLALDERLRPAFGVHGLTKEFRRQGHRCRAAPDPRS